jgi:hypothetical protein
MHTTSQEALSQTDLLGVKSASHDGAWSYVAAASLALFYLASSVYISSHRLLWFDEVFTVHIARLPYWRTILAALGHGADSLPPLYYVVVRMFGRLFGPSEVAVRLPSTVAMIATLVITFDCARRLTDGLHGLIALAIAAGPLAGEGFEARSYAFYTMFAALALWVWAYTGTGEKWSAIWFGVVLFLSVNFHYYAFLLLVPFALWEISRWKPWQPPSAKLIAGVIGVAIPALLLSHFIFSFSRRFATGFWSRPSWHELLDIYSHIFVGGLFVLALAAVWIVLAERKHESVSLLPMLLVETIGWLYLCIPLAGFAAAELRTNAFAVRYFLALVPGVAVAFACWTWRYFRNNRPASMGILVLLIGWGMVHQLYIVRHVGSVESPNTRSYLALEEKFDSEGKHFFVFSDPFLFLEAQYYSKYPGRYVLLLPPDFNPDRAARGAAPDPYMHQRVELVLSDYYPLQFWRMDELRSHARDVALIKPTPAAMDDLMKAGVASEIRFSQPVNVLYLQ